MAKGTRKQVRPFSPKNVRSTMMKAGISAIVAHRKKSGYGLVDSLNYHMNRHTNKGQGTTKY